eukprot:COSAG01_NODE_4994_length_4559_cov_6.934529_6_plen_53_part_00
MCRHFFEGLQPCPPPPRMVIIQCAELYRGAQIPRPNHHRGGSQSVGRLSTAG